MSAAHLNSSQAKETHVRKRLFFFFLCWMNLKTKSRNSARRRDRKHCLPFIEFGFGLFLCLEICSGGHSTCHRDWKAWHYWPCQVNRFSPLVLVLMSRLSHCFCYLKSLELHVHPWISLPWLQLQNTFVFFPHLELADSLARVHVKSHNISAYEFMWTSDFSPRELSVKPRKMCPDCSFPMSYHDKFAIWGLVLLIANHKCNGD